MELLLNLLWLAISLAVCAAWQFRWRHDHSRYHSTAAAGVALACLVVLLFFPISLTDDLHADLVLASDVSAKRRDAGFIAAHQGPEHRNACLSRASGPAILPQTIVFSLTARFAARTAAAPSIIGGMELQQPTGRAPPSFLAS